GISGYLRQEFRELEILDEITRMRHEGVLPASVTGIYRKRLIRSFYVWRSDHRDPIHFHPAMKWDSSMGPRIPEKVVYSEWRSSDMASKKRKSTGGEIRRPTKKAKTAAHPPIIDSGYGAPSHFIPSQRAPVGMVWDSRDHSCGYDSTFTILANMWAEDSARWHNVFS
ncbi:hypothetical protein C8R44DRAFT_559676, partial [Mycena epipterygia]